MSSTATVETEHFVRLSESLIQKGHAGLPESDDIEGAREGLTTGYGQSKWVAEKVIMEAGKRGLAGWIVRPGYVVGDSESAGTFSLFFSLFVRLVLVTFLLLLLGDLVVSSSFEKLLL